MGMLRGVWQALSCLFIHATFCVIATGASSVESKMWQKLRFLAKRNYVMSVVCLSVTFVHPTQTVKIFGNILLLLSSYVMLGYVVLPFTSLLSQKN